MFIAFHRFACLTLSICFETNLQKRIPWFEAFPTERDLVEAMAKSTGKPSQPTARIACQLCVLHRIYLELS